MGLGLGLDVGLGLGCSSVKVGVTVMGRDRASVEAGTCTRGLRKG